jgi:biotin carboxyl carrier protein
VAAVSRRDGGPGGGRAVHPRAVRVGLIGPSLHKDGVVQIVVEPPDAGGATGHESLPPTGTDGTDGNDPILVDGVPTVARLDRHGPVHAVLTEGLDPPERTRLLLLPAAESSGRPRQAAGGIRREVVVDGWRFEVEVDSERRAGLRERARRGHEDAANDGPTEVHAMIPGVVVSISVVPGDAVVAGQQVLVVEAMKMQNEVRSPRDGVVGRVAVGERQTIEVGDLLLVLE